MEVRKGGRLKGGISGTGLLGSELQRRSLSLFKKTHTKTNYFL